MRGRWLVLMIVGGCSTGQVGGPNPGVEPEVIEPGPTDPVEEPTDEPLRGARGTVPIYGGTMTSAGSQMMVADPGTDTIFIVGQGLGDDVVTVQLDEGAEPFRMVADDGDLYASLRGSGEIARVELAGHAVTTASVCAEPRGVAMMDDSVLVACASGELVELTRDLQLIRSQTITRDLRDVVVDGDAIWLSTFHDARVLRLDAATLAVLQQVTPALAMTEQAHATPRVAWRMRAHPEGGVIVMHQGATNEPIALSGSGSGSDTGRPPGGGPNGEGGNAYGDPMDVCFTGKSTSSTHFTHVTEAGVQTGGALTGGSPRFDFSLSGNTLYVPNGVSLRNDGMFGGNGEIEPMLMITELDTAVTSPGCVFEFELEPTQPGHTVSAVEHTADGRRFHYSRDLGQLTADSQLLQLEDAPVASEASQLFHGQVSSGLACASCHPEGQDDGHVWHFEGLGARRTQNLAGGVTARAPFHWDGEFPNLDDLMVDVFVDRMGGPEVTPDQTEKLGDWLDDIPPLRSAPASAPALVEDGRALFEGAAGCASCHSGEQYTDSQLHVVRSGEPATKTPSLLGIGARAPYMHDGCAETLQERFSDVACGGDLHGSTQSLAADDVHALVTYLESL